MIVAGSLEETPYLPHVLKDTSWENILGEHVGDETMWRNSSFNSLLLVRGLQQRG